MVKTQFFERDFSNLEKYKNNLKEALQMIRTVRLFNNEVIDFLNNWINNQKSYIPREDVDNLNKNMKFIFKDKKFYDYCLEKLNLVKNSWNILEYSFNLISKSDDLSKDYNKIKNKIIFEEKLKESQKSQKKKMRKKWKNY